MARGGNKKETQENAERTAEAFDGIKTAADLKEFLLSIRDKMTDHMAAPIFALSAINHILNHSNIYSLLNDANKEIARDIWLRLKKSGLQLRNPPLLFDPDGHDIAGA